jgi:hypothetical protein
VYDFDVTGNVVKKYPVDTGDHCRQIRYLLVTPEQRHQAEAVLTDERHDWRIDIRGPSEFVAEQKKVWTRPGFKVRTFLTDRPTARVRESEGIGSAFRKYIKDYKPKNGTPVEVLEQMARERLAV